MTAPTQTIDEVRRRYEPAQQSSQREVFLPRETEVASMTGLSIVLGGLFVAYAMQQRKRLRTELKKTKEKVSDKTLYEMNKRLFDNDIERLVATLVPALVEGMVAGVREAGLVRSSPELMERVARQYAVRLGESIHETSSEALMQGFRAQVNRNVPARVAAERVIDAFGVAPRTMKSLVNIWLGKPVKFQTSSRVKTPKAKEKADALAAKAIMDRAKVIGDTESYQAKNMAKSIVWIKDAKDGKLQKTARVVWYTRSDERVCETCGPMHGKYRKPDSPWTLPDGGRSWGPQVHPRCRCEQILVPEVSQPILDMTIRQAEMFEGGETSSLAIPDLVSKAFTVDGQYDKFSRDSGGKFASADTRQRRTNRGVSVKPAAVAERPRAAVAERPVANAAVDRLLQQTAQYAATQGASTGVAPVAGSIAPKRSTIAPKRSAIAPVKSAIAPRADTVPQIRIAEPEVKRRAIAAVKTVAGVAIAPISITAKALDLNETKVTSEVVAEIAQDIQAKSATKTTTSTKWAKTHTPMFSISFPEEVLDFEDNIVTDNSQEFFEGASSPEKIDAQLAAYWEHFAETRLDSVFDNMQSRAMGDEDRFYDSYMEDDAEDDLMSGKDWDDNYGGVIFRDFDGNELILNREDYRRVFYASFGMSGDDYADRVVDDLIVRDASTREESTASIHVDEILQDFDFAEEIRGHTPILLVTEYLNTEESTTPSSDGGTSIPGRWRATGTIHNSPTTELPCDIVYVEPEDL